MISITSQTEEMKNLFSSLSLNYITGSIQIVELSKKCLDHSAYYKRNLHEFLELSEQYSQSIKDNYIIDSTVRYVNETVGRGFYTEQDLSPLDFIGQYCGIVQRASRCKPIIDKLGGYATDYAWTYPVKQGLYSLEVNARVNGNELRFVNHSFDANCRMEHTLIEDSWILFLVAQKKISAGEQITVDYGVDYWSSGHRTLVIL